jgi:hypothetical protein
MGECSANLKQFWTCTQAKSCEDCINAPANCGWCSVSSKCLPGTLTGPRADAGSCSSGWSVNERGDPEPRFNITAPTNESTWELGGEYLIEWEGGGSSVRPP